MGQTLRLRISEISLDILRRLHDTKIELNVGTLYLEDSLRPKTQRFLIRSTNLDNEGHVLNNSKVPVEAKDKKSVDFATTSISSETGLRISPTSREPSGSLSMDNDTLNGLKNFAKLTVTQVFDFQSPYKYEMNRSVITTFKKNNSDDKNNNNENENKNEKDEDKIEDRELDEELIILTTGLILSLDANAVKHVHIILEPLISNLLATPINRNPHRRPQARDNLFFQSPRGNNEVDIPISEYPKSVRYDPSH